MWEHKIETLTLPSVQQWAQWVLKAVETIWILYCFENRVPSTFRIWNYILSKICLITKYLKQKVIQIWNFIWEHVFCWKDPITYNNMLGLNQNRNSELPLRSMHCLRRTILWLFPGKSTSWASHFTVTYSSQLKNTDKAATSYIYMWNKRQKIMPSGHWVSSWLRKFFGGFNKSFNKRTLSLFICIFQPHTVTFILIWLWRVHHEICQS